MCSELSRGKLAGVVLLLDEGVKEQKKGKRSLGELYILYLVVSCC